MKRLDIVGFLGIGLGLLVGCGSSDASDTASGGSAQTVGDAPPAAGAKAAAATTGGALTLANWQADPQIQAIQAIITTLDQSTAGTTESGQTTALTKEQRDIEHSESCDSDQDTDIIDLYEDASHVPRKIHVDRFESVDNYYAYPDGHPAAFFRQIFGSQGSTSSQSITDEVFIDESGKVLFELRAQKDPANPSAFVAIPAGQDPITGSDPREPFGTSSPQDAPVLAPFTSLGDPATWDLDKIFDALPDCEERVPAAGQ